MERVDWLAEAIQKGSKQLSLTSLIVAGENLQQKTSDQPSAVSSCLYGGWRPTPGNFFSLRLLNPRCLVIDKCA